MYVTHSCCTMALVLYVCPFFSLTPAHTHTQQFSLGSCHAQHAVLLSLLMFAYEE